MFFRKPLCTLQLIRYKDIRVHPNIIGLSLTRLYYNMMAKIKIALIKPPFYGKITALNIVADVIFRL